MASLSPTAPTQTLFGHNWRRRRWFIFGLFVLTTILIFHGPSLRISFLSDDYDWITRAEQNIQTGDVFQPLRSKIGGNFYRPLPALSFTLDSAIGQRRVVVFHIHQLLLLLALALSVGWLIYLLFQSFPLAVITALLFSVYPSHHEVVTWLAGRPDLLATLWMVVSSATLLKYLDTKRGWWLVGLIISTTLALLSKESALVLPAIHLGLIGWYKWQHRATPYKQLLFVIIPSLVLLTSILVIRGLVLTDAIGGYRLGGQNIGLHIPLNSLLAPFTSFRMLINLPYWASIATDPISTLLTHHFHGVLLVGGALFTILLILLTLFRRHSRWLVAPIVLALAWVVITFIPMLGLTGAIGADLEGSRLFFTPSIGYCLLWASLLTALINQRKPIGLVLSALLILSFGCLSIFNLQPWRQASQTVNHVSQALTQNRDTLLPVELTDVVVSGLPGKNFGAYEFWGPHIVEAIMQTAARRDLGVFVGGSGRFADSPFCRAGNPPPHIGVLHWAGSSNAWERNTGLVNKIATDRLDRQVFSKVYWQPSNLATNYGAFSITGGNSALITSLPNVDGAAIRGLTVTLTDINTSSRFGSRRATVDWAVNGIFDSSRHISYTIPANQASFTIPLCEYLNWSLAENITAIKLRPLQAGSFKFTGAKFISTVQ